jgi:hypothetical protein
VLGRNITFARSVNGFFKKFARLVVNFTKICRHILILIEVGQH